MNFKKSAQGAISVFLVVILVPMMALSALFVDLSRIKLAKEMAASATELTLNTALSDYDTKLKQLYGILATAKSPSEMQDELKSYYKSCITSSGVSGPDADDYVGNLMNMIGLTPDGDGEISDWMNVQLVDDSFGLSQVGASSTKGDGDKDPLGSSIANPALLKREIVEFMKFRSPINTGLRFVNALKSISSLQGQTDLVNKRQEYYEEEEELGDLLQTAWGMILEYNRIELVANKKFDRLVEIFNSAHCTNNLVYYDLLKEAHNASVLMLYNYQGNTEFNTRIGYKQMNVPKETDGTMEMQYWYTFKTGDTVLPTAADEYNKIPDNKVITMKEMTDLITAIQNAFHTSSIYSRGFNDLYDTNKAFYDKRGAGDAIQQERLLIQAIKYHDLREVAGLAKTIYEKYQKLKSYYSWINAHKDNEAYTNSQGVFITQQKVNGTQTLESLYRNAENLYNRTINTSNGFPDTCNVFSDWSLEYTPILHNMEGVLNNRLSALSSEARKLYRDLEEAHKKIQKARKKMQQVPGKLQDLKKKLAEWERAASSSELSETPLGKQDMAEIKDICEKVKVEDVNELVSRLSLIEGRLKGLLQESQQIKKFRYMGKFVADIASLNDLQNAMRSKIGRDPLGKELSVYKTELEQNAEAWYNDNVTLVSLDTEWYQLPNTCPYLTGTSEPEFCKYLSGKFGNVELGFMDIPVSDKEDKSNGKDLYKNIKDTRDNTTEKELKPGDGIIPNPPNDREINKDDTRPSKLAQMAAENDSSSCETNGKTTKTAKALKQYNIFSQIFNGMRDKLYVADYALSMFSYDTVNVELQKVNKENGGNPNEKPKTLTLTEINEKNNFAYGREVEYILYGNSNSKNVAIAYASIYGIRLGFNLIYAFSDSTIRETAMMIAIPISAATAGVIPAPLIQAVIIVGIACIESTIDILTLKNGEKVPLFKTKETWVCSPQGIVKKAKEAAKVVAIQAVNQVVDMGRNKLNELLDLTDEKLQEWLDKGKDDLGLFLDEAIDDHVMKHAGIAIQKLLTLCCEGAQKLGANQFANEQEAFEFIRSGLDHWVESLKNANQVVYFASKKAVDLIMNSSQRYVEEVFREVYTLMNTDKESLQSFIDGILGDGALYAVGEEHDLPILTGAAKKLGGLLKELKSQIKQKIIDPAFSEIITVKNEIKASLSDKVSSGADKLKANLESSLEKAFGSNGPIKSGDSTGLASMLDFRYSDYLRLFLMVKLYTNEEGVLLRIADVIQSNTKINLSDRAAYVQLDTQLMVKPILFTLPIFGNVIENPETNSNWYLIEEKGLRGY